MKRDRAIQALLRRIDKEFEDIEAEYKYCLNKKKLSENVKINILDYFLHNKTILDYLGQEIAIYCPKKPKKIYFPIAKRNEKQPQFEKKLKRWFPGLKTANPNLYHYLIEIQHWNGNEFLPDFNDVLNCYKHVDDVQEKMATFYACTLIFRDRVVRVGERGIKWIDINGPNGRLCFEAGNGDKAFIKGVQKITGRTKKLKKADPRIVIKNEKWRDFKFDVSEHSIIGLLDITRLNVFRIYNRIKSIINGD